MLLRNRIKFPSLKKRPHVTKKKSILPIKCNNTRQLPLEIQEIICFMVLGEDASSSFAVTAMCVCKTWANFICERLYRKYQFKGYMQFIGFVQTISLPNPLLPYNLYVREINFESVNKYGVDMRVRKLIRYCPNIINITFGYSTSVKANTLQMMSKYCQKVQTLQMGGIQSFPFMLDCDFSGMTNLRQLSLTTTPIQSLSLQTLPVSLRQLQLVQMDALNHQELIQFIQHHPKLTSLSIQRCKLIHQAFVDIITQLPGLNELELYGSHINDLSLTGLFHIPMTLNKLTLCYTQITDATLDAIANGCLVVNHLNIIAHNQSITQFGINCLLKKKQFMSIQ
ncbi:hypothetical protein BD770DRAFT_429130 [Pilaira anomala]|nr:hypothetical protein BD770DRAFT_429130 [Pilaira anomala]